MGIFAHTKPRTDMLDETVQTLHRHAEELKILAAKQQEAFAAALAQIPNAQCRAELEEVMRAARSGALHVEQAAAKIKEIMLKYGC